MYLSSYEDDKCCDKALHHIYNAAKQGSSDAMVLFGRLHCDTNFEFSKDFNLEYKNKQDSTSALEWYKKAMKLENSSAFFYAGALYESDDNLKNLNLSKRMYKHASLIGSIQAKQRLDELMEMELIGSF